MSIEDLIDNIANQDFANAGPMFSDIIHSKIADAFEAEKAALAAHMFNGPEDDEEDEEEYDEEDEDYEDEDEEE